MERDREREGGEGREGWRLKRETICNFTDTEIQVHI